MSTTDEFDLYVRANPERMNQYRREGYEAGRNEGIAQAKADSLKQFAALQKQYGNHPLFVIEHFNKGSTVEAAAPEYVDLLEEENKQLRVKTRASGSRSAAPETDDDDDDDLQMRCVGRQLGRHM